MSVFIKERRFGVLWARLKASAGHIWSAGRILSMSGLNAVLLQSDHRFRYPIM
jgi:hypothetical protein